VKDAPPPAHFAFLSQSFSLAFIGPPSALVQARNEKEQIWPIKRRAFHRSPAQKGLRYFDK
jgi:hypothetical protein